MHQVGRDTTISSIIKMANGMTYSKHTPSKGGEGSAAWYPNICPSRIFALLGDQHRLSYYQLYLMKILIT